LAAIALLGLSNTAAAQEKKGEALLFLIAGGKNDPDYKKALQALKTGVQQRAGVEAKGVRQLLLAR